RMKPNTGHTFVGLRVKPTQPTKNQCFRGFVSQSGCSTLKAIPPEKEPLAAQLQILADNYQFVEIIKLLNFS
ncbi:MAG: hypothetical protein QNJ72_38770, partial [Pleurocapsa sp. MO_226.B13]|nr:hypothetical protein [Pleurocapsa sp. MO_226.B13]